MKKLTKKQIEELAVRIRSYLLDKKLWADVRIYFNGKAFSTDKDGKYYYNDAKNLVVLHDIDPNDYTEYAGDILTMTFEGPLYDCFNYGGDFEYQVQEDLSNLFGEYGLYYELGNSWNLSLFEK